VDYNEEIENYYKLIHEEGRKELRDKLAGCYNDRGIELEEQGHFKEAVLDYDRAIQLYEQLALKENQKELRNELALCYFNRGILRCRIEDWEQAVVDIDISGNILKELIKDGQSQLVWQFLKVTGFRISFVKELGDIKKTVECTNDGLHWLFEKARVGDKSRELMEATHLFMDELNKHKELLLQEGLDKNIYNFFDFLLNRKKRNL
jgi:tetratricopeptide (TPR) repeat protein